MGKIKKDGVVTIEDSNTIGNSHEIVEGLQFDRGYISPYMMTNPERMEAVLEDPYVLVTDKKISSINELLPLLEKLVKTGKKNWLLSPTMLKEKLWRLWLLINFAEFSALWRLKLRALATGKRNVGGYRYCYWRFVYFRRFRQEI